MRFLLALSALSPAVGHAACPAPATTADLAAAIEEAKGAYAEVNADAFRAASERVRATVPCLGDGIARHLAAEIHRQAGLAAFVEKDRERAVAAFSAARGIEEGWRFPEVMVPAGHPVARWVEESAPPTARVGIPAPAEGHVAVDGVESSERFEGVPSVVQVFDGSGRVATTAYVWPDDPWPAYPTVESAMVEGVEREREREGAKARRWWIGTGIAALTTGVLYGANVAVHQQYVDEDTPPEDLDRLRATNNALVVASGVGLATTVGLGMVALAVQF